jgi:hypothetical protein
MLSFGMSFLIDGPIQKYKTNGLFGEVTGKFNFRVGDEVT